MNINKMVELYQSVSKHSNYQILPAILEKILPTERISVNSRYESERLDFLNQHIDFKGAKVVDIGGNTGFFTFESIRLGAKEVIHIEGNKEHSDFVALAAKELDLNIRSENKYIDFVDGDDFPENVDITLLFNVIHHLGDDFGDQTINIEKAKQLMADCINYFHGKTDTLILQLGFCWKGDRNLLLFENGTKDEMIDFVMNTIDGKWRIQAIGVAELEKDKTVFNLLNDFNRKRIEEIGEFRNRPVFILNVL